MTESPSNPTLDYRKYISQGWIRSRLQDFELLRRLRDDPFFRRIWIDNEEETRCRKDSNLDNAVFRDLLHAYLDAFEFKIRRNLQVGQQSISAPKPSVASHIPGFLAFPQGTCPQR